MGALMGSLVGATEANVRQALRIADAMAPCVLFCDELEKGLRGVASSGQTESDVFFVGTSNDISKLPPEFSRAERLDACFFLDLPGPQEKEAIWRMHAA